MMHNGTKIITIKNKDDYKFIKYVKYKTFKKRYYQWLCICRKEIII